MLLSLIVSCKNGQEVIVVDTKLRTKLELIRIEGICRMLILKVKEEQL